MTNSVVDKKLARFLSSLPSEDLQYLVRADSEAQKYFFDCQNENRLLSKCWMSRILGRDNPLKDALEEGIIAPAVHAQYWRTTRFIQSMWGVIQIGERHIRKQAEREKLHYPFTSAFDLFKTILQGWRDLCYLTAIEDSSFQVSRIKDGALIAKSYLKNNLKLATNPEEFKSITSPFEPIFNKTNFWFIFSMHSCELAREKDETLRDELSAFYNQMENDLEGIIEWLGRKRASKSHPKLKTTHWINQTKHRT